VATDNAPAKRPKRRRAPRETTSPRLQPRKIRKARAAPAPPSAVLDAGRVKGKLTTRQRLFVREFVAGRPGVRGVAIRAAEAAGYSLGDMGIGAQLVRTPSVRAAIARYFAKWDRQAQDVIDELRRVGFSDIRNYVEWDGKTMRVRPYDELTDDAASAVAESRQGADGEFKFRLHDKIAALAMLAKFLGVAGDRAEHVGRHGRPVEVEHVHVYVPANGREVDAAEACEAPGEVAEFKALPPAPRSAPASSALVDAGILLPASGRSENGR